MRRLLALLVLAAGILPAAGAAPALAQPTGSIGIRLLEAPTDRVDDPRAQTYVVDHLPLGATVERRVEVTNTTTDAQEVALYAAGADVSSDGWTVLDGREGNELSDMVTVTPSPVTVPAGGVAEATMTLRVPGDASQREHYGVIWAEVTAEGGSVTVKNRVGIRLYVSIGSGSEPPSDFVVEALTAARGQDGAPEVRATVHNGGGRALDLTGELILTDGPGGLSAGPFPTETTSTLGIGARAPVVVRLDPALPDGPWTARMTVRSGRLERVVEAAITFPASPGDAGEAVTATPVEEQRRLLLPVAGGLVGVALLGLALAPRHRRKRRREDGEPARELAQVR